MSCLKSAWDVSEVLLLDFCRVECGNFHFSTSSPTLSEGPTFLKLGETLLRTEEKRFDFSFVESFVGFGHLEGRIPLL